MPELPEVEVLRLSLEPHLVGDTIERVEVSNPALREPVDVAKLRKPARGREIIALRRRSKYLLIDLAGGGPWSPPRDERPADPGAGGDSPRAPRARRLHLRSGRRLRFRDPRRFGVVFAVKTAGLDADPHFAHLGVEPLEPGFSGATLAAAAAGRRGPVKPFLMDAGVVVGIGNIYASESLHRAGVHPERSVARISGRAGSASPRPGWRSSARRSARGGRPQRLRGRRGERRLLPGLARRLRPRGEPCRTCGREVRRLVQAGRSTFYCPGCQR